MNKLCPFNDFNPCKRNCGLYVATDNGVGACCLFAIGYEIYEFIQKFDRILKGFDEYEKTRIS